jgi:hypothetical protein
MDNPRSDCCSHQSNLNVKQSIQTQKPKKGFDKQIILAILSVVLVVVGTILKSCVRKS